METALLIISILLIAIVLLQSNKASDASQIITGGNSELFSNQKERGAELLISRITFVLGMAFFILSFVIYMIQLLRVPYLTGTLLLLLNLWYIYKE